MCASIACEETSPEDHDAVEHLLDLSFGSDRRSKTSYRLREGNAPVPGLSLVVRDQGVSLQAPSASGLSPSGTRKRLPFSSGPLRCIRTGRGWGSASN
jgi:hypothetical protein